MYNLHDKITVEFTGMVLSVGSQINSTSEVQENATGKIHFLYLHDQDGLGLSGISRLRPGDVVTVSFTGEVTGTVRSDGRVSVHGETGSYTHYVDVSSPNVWPAGAWPKPEPKSGERIIWHRVS